MKSDSIFLHAVLFFLVAISFNTVAGNSEGYSAKQPDKIVGAVCVIRNGDNLVMLSEAITNKLSLPGGYIDSGDTPQEAAAREALEEAGIEVEVTHLIQYRDRSAIYACRAISPIPVSSFKTSRGYTVVASWFAKHFATEVERVYLMDPTTAEAREYRYPEDTARLTQWLVATPESEVKVYDRFEYDATPLHEFELSLIGQFQQSTSTWPPFLQWLWGSFANMTTVLGGPGFVLITVAVMAGFYRTPLLLEIAFLVVAALFGISVLKHSLMLPRPFFIVPELQQANASGFGFPSMHMVIMSLLFGVWGYLLHLGAKTKQQTMTFVLIASLLVAGLGGARVWLGVNFISDVVLSLMLGVGLVVVFALFQTGTLRAFRQKLSSRWVWLGLGLAAAVMASVSLVPVQAYLSTLLLGIFLASGYALKVDAIMPPLSVRRSLLASMGTLVGAIGIFTAMVAFTSVQTSTLMVLAIKGLGYLLLGCWLVSGSSWIRRQLSR